MRRQRRDAHLVLSGFMSSCFLLTFSSFVKVQQLDDVTMRMDPTHTHLLARINTPEQHHSCALLFFGLPRSYESLVLPSIVENVLIPNLEYNCDVFVHAPRLTSEAPGRSGKGGVIDPTAIFKLEERVLELYRNSTFTPPTVKIITDSEDDFFQHHNSTLHKYKTAISNTTNKLLYHPWATRTYVYPITMENMVRQWHSIQSVWTLMKESNKSYTRMAMLRNDVFYATPIDLYDTKYPHNSLVLPGFAMYPVNDRMVIGSYEAVNIWATRRFDLLDDYVMHKVPKPGLGMHSEHYLNTGILPVIQNETNATIYTDGDVCFWRTRADASVWINDCDKERINGIPLKLHTGRVIEKLSGLRCNESRLNRAVIQALCQ